MILLRLPVSRLALITGIVILNIFIAVQCLAKEVAVELVWKLGQVGWLNITVEEGPYELIADNLSCRLPAGSSLQMGWGGWAPVIRINHENFQILRGSAVELKEISKGSLKITSFKGEQFSYRGGLSLTWLSDRWKLVNHLEEEDYLKGVVPIEMSNAWAGDGLEALKAQAVTARTFMVKKMQGKEVITDSPDIDQAYAGKASEGLATAAVVATSGQILVDKQTLKPIDAYYSSHNGGYTEAVENVWGNRDIHYSAHPDQFSKGIGGAADQWRFIASAEVIGKSFGLGPIKQIELDKFPSGRVKAVKLADRAGQVKTITGREFVKAFYPFGKPINKFALLGNFFEVSYIPAENSQEVLPGMPGSGFLLEKKELRGPLLTKIISSNQGTSQTVQPYGVFIFKGQGWGHGVGMSQWGAYHMAQLGYSYSDILSFYYDNVLLMKR
ncbi:MAG: SpoIID/LytB domain-containing protein [Desulfitobacteriaceae bacterium]|nr:SpoIID/LytB domain-containing protein [Desulfitobacteriaceae bacterium]MDD4346999.1 SpoIID/LytB domain-containing protein [Desulfitobacteriaceae bacterium]MDD4402083.1 SpoIID/LytB domain-containing protein [Desulfitobacteriaceae bacterium]